MVQAGEVLVTLRNPALLAERERIAAELAQAEQGAYASMGSDLGKAGMADEQVQRWQSERARMDERIAALQVRAHRSGRLVLSHTEDLPGRYLHRGDMLGHVLSGDTTTVRVAVPDQDIAPLRERTQAVSVSGAQVDAFGLPARLLRDSVGATHLLPSAALSADMGGQIQTDPQDEHHTKTLQPVVIMDVQLREALREDQAPSSLRSDRLGERVWVRFDQGWSPLPSQAWRWLQHRALVDFSAQH
jgi:putative peptide zinc metalloprotease protein